MNNNEIWDWEITPRRKWNRFHFKDISQHNGLIISFFRRELLSGYNQTVMGMFWIVLQPLLVTFFYYIVFNRIVKVPIGNTPPFLFYMAGSIIWSFFNDCFAGTMNSFLYNAHIFNKVYFPRLVVPIATTLNHLVRFGIQLVIFIVVYAVVAWRSGGLHPDRYLLLLPFIIFLLALYAFSLGILFSLLVARYRDVEYLMHFTLRLYMFFSPVVYPSAIVPERLRILFWLNPLTPIIEYFRFGFWGGQVPDIKYLVSATVAVIALAVLGLFTFREKEIIVMDTI